MRRLGLWGLVPIYLLTIRGLDGIVALLLSNPEPCSDRYYDVLRAWVTGTFVCHLLLGFASRHILLLWLAPGSSVLVAKGAGRRYAMIDGLTVVSLVALTVLLPKAVIYFSAAPLIPVAAAFWLTWAGRRGFGERLEWQHLLFGFEIALVMWIGAIHAGRLTLLCVE